jgi:Ca2+-binding RTX toxin-like protein
MAQKAISGKTGDDTLIRTSESSIIDADSGDDSIVGSNYYDQIYGGSSAWREEGLVPGYQGAYMREVGDDDTINARGGNDVIYVGTGRDSIDGGAGIDQLNFYFGGQGGFYHLESVSADLSRFAAEVGTLTRVTVDLQAGVYSGVYRDADRKTVGSNSGTFRSIEAVLGSVGDDTIYGSKNNDQFKPIRGNDYVDGRGGLDIISYNDAGIFGITVDVAAGRVVDTFGDLDRISNIEHFVGSGGADTFKGTAGEQVFTGGNSADTFNGGGGTDMVDYHLEQGTFAIRIELADRIGWDMYDKKDSFDSIENIRGSNRGDAIRGNDLANEFWGDLGDDKLEGRGRKDTLHGGEGDDSAQGGDGDDSLLGDAGEDTLEGGADVDTLRGGDGKDTLDGQSGNDVLYGEDGDDTLLDAEISSTATEFTFEKKYNRLYGGDGNDTLKGAGELFGEDGKDQLFGVGTLHGGEGDDELTGFVDPNLPYVPHAYLVGGPGNDKLREATEYDYIWSIADYSYVTHGMTIALSKQKVTVTAGDVDTLFNMRGLRGTAYGDKLSGTSGDDRIEGGGDADLIKGGDGDDELFGDTGNDTLFGGAGNDFLVGGSGNDELHTGGGNDDGGIDAGGGNDTIYLEGGGRTDHYQKVTGGAGNDTIIASGGYNNIVGGGGTDRFIFEAHEQHAEIENFKRGEKIDLSAFDISSFSALQKAMADEVAGYAVHVRPSEDVIITIFGFHRDEMTKADFIL